MGLLEAARGSAGRGAGHVPAAFRALLCGAGLRRKAWLVAHERGAWLLPARGAEQAERGWRLCTAALFPAPGRSSRQQEPGNGVGMEGALKHGHHRGGTRGGLGWLGWTRAS